MDRGQEHHVEFVESGEHSWEAVDTADWAFDFEQSPVHGAVMLPGGDALLLGRYHRDEAEPGLLSQRLASFGGLVGMLKSFKNRGSR